jgi:hypothetical protein
MKRWSLFLAIFIAGLAVLWWIDRGRRKPAPPTPVRTEEPDSNALTEVELGKDKQGKVEAGGPFLDTKFDAAGLAVHRVSARNFSSLGDGVYRFDDLVARFFVPGTDRLRLEVRAKTARGRLRTMPALEFDRDHPVELEDVVATLHEGSPFAPLTLRVPSATGKFADESFSSSERVEIKGTGLSADGLGLSFRGLERVLDLERDTHANLILDDGTPASLSASKGLTFTSLEKLGEGATRVVAKDQAHLAFEGAHPLVVDADVVELDALVSHAKKSVRPTEIRAHGNVKLAPVDGKFFGDEGPAGAGGRRPPAPRQPDRIPAGDAAPARGGHEQGPRSPGPAKLRHGGLPLGRGPPGGGPPRGLALRFPGARDALRALPGDDPGGPGQTQRHAQGGQRLRPPRSPRQRGRGGGGLAAGKQRADRRATPGRRWETRPRRSPPSGRPTPPGPCPTAAPSTCPPPTGWNSFASRSPSGCPWPTTWIWWSPAPRPSAPRPTRCAISTSSPSRSPEWARCPSRTRTAAGGANG